MERGFDISGIDLSKEMLEKLMEKAPTAHIIQADIMEYHPAENYYDEKTQTQFMPGIYELYQGSALLQSETMDFQTHLYRFGEMEEYLKEIGFTKVKTYSSFSKNIAVSDIDEMFLFECTVE